MKTTLSFYLSGISIRFRIVAVLLLSYSMSCFGQVDTLESGRLKSGEEIEACVGSITASDFTDDAYIKVTWSGFDNPCWPETNSYGKLWRIDVFNVQETYIGQFSGEGNTYTDYRGPGQGGDRYFYRVRVYWEGGIWPFTCSGYSCLLGDYGNTSDLRKPGTVTATYDDYDDKIVVSWGASSTKVKAEHYEYHIYRDGDYLDKRNSSTYSYTDENVVPGIEYDYKVKTYSPHWNKSSAFQDATTKGRAFYLNVRTESLQSGVRILWSNVAPLVNDPEEFSIKRRDGDNPADFLINIEDATATSWVDQTSQEGVPYPGYSYSYIVTPKTGSVTFVPDSAIGTRLPNGIISGTVKAPLPAQGPVAGVALSAERLDSVPQGEITTYYDTTNSEGEFEIRDIYYYTGAEFKVTPYLEDHGFKPAADTVYLDLANPEKTSEFEDTSSFSITGKVIQIFNKDTCAIKGVEILINDIPEGYKTNNDGNFALTVNKTDNYTFKPQLNDHLFDPESVGLYVDDDVEDLLFIDTTIYTLEGEVLGPCGIYIGKADLRIMSINGACFDTTITSDSLGHYMIELPAREYDIVMAEFYPENPGVVSAGEVKLYFSSMVRIDLTEGNQDKNWIFRKPPVIEVSGFENYGCGAYNVPILEQGMAKFIYITVKEIFGESECNTDTGFIVVRDDLVDGETKVDTIYLEYGQATYKIVPENPEFVAPHLQLLEITAHVDDATDMYNQQILVTGNTPRTSTFATVTPEIPFMILRDPPGDGSNSYLSEGTTSNYKFSMSLERSASLNAWAQVKVGAKYEAGQFIFTEFEVWGSVKAAMEIGASLKSSTELDLSITNGQEFRTSGDPGITGEDGDVFAGAALNIEYALTDILEYDPDECAVKTDVDIIMGVTGFNTTFIYTESHIQDVLIPQLAQLRDIYASEGSDSAKVYADHIIEWQEILDLNNDLKKKSKFIDNKSFSAGTSYESYTEITKNITRSIEYTMYIEGSVAIEAGVEIGGIGASGGVEIKARMELGGSESVSHQTSQKTGFVLTDDDDGDFFSVDIREDLVYGTPVFDLVSGRSSCPWEPGTQLREAVRLTTDTYYREIANPDDPAVFTLTLANKSESDEDRTYNLVFLQESNPDGAALTLGGSEVQGGIPTPYEIPAWSSINATVTVSRGQVAYDYNNLRFELSSPCDGAISDEVALSVSFASPCSPIEINQPNDDWVITEENLNVIPILFSGYDTSIMELAEVQFSPAGANSWATIVYFDNNLLEEVSTSHDWIIDYIKDGLYDIRAMVRCESAIGYSDVVTGLIDRKPPKVFGLPEPTDGVMDEGDLVSVTFDEPINCPNVSAANVTFTNMDTEQVIGTQVGCSVDKIIILPNMAGQEFENTTFRVDVTGIEDVYGNVMKDTVSWLITVEGPEDLEIGFNEDTDGDSIPNNQDNCPLAYNPEQDDLDEDNLGDQCDPDIEGDGIDNFQDNCPFDSNFDQSNIDGDLMGDACDPDMDGDGILNALDNCPSTSNITQSDANSNGIGDACDVTYVADGLPGTGIYALLDNYPNPFGEITNIAFEVSEQCRVTISIYNVMGEKISSVADNHEVLPGHHELQWKRENFANGIYFYSMHVRDANNKPVYFAYKKMIISR